MIDVNKATEADKIRTTGKTTATNKVTATETVRPYEEIIEHVKMMIVKGEVKQGEKLPSERDLADYFHVSRVPVREALKILEYLGVLYNVRGDGMYVKSIDVAHLFDKINFAFATTPTTLSELYEVRNSLESTAAYYAALRRDDDDIARMQISLDQVERAIEISAPQQELITLSHKFHSHLVTAAKNSLLSAIYDSFYELLNVSKHLTVGASTYDYDSQASHYEIFKGILLKDPIRAQNAMRAHLDRAKEKMHTTMAQPEYQKQE